MTDDNPLPENNNTDIVTKDKFASFGDMNTDQLKMAVMYATAAEVIKTTILDVFQNEVYPSDSDILRYLVIESNH